MLTKTLAGAISFSVTVSISVWFSVSVAAAADGATFYTPSPLEAELEPEYAKAILKLRAGAHDDAVRALDALLGKLSGKSAPRDRTRILELQALARGMQGEDAKARDLYGKYLALVKERQAPEAEAAPGLFALAL